ncbi:RagB/SusD family nutrient uptake outer membrane protein [Natronoflexus pectinivorans]|uniref:Putative outer membrane starch-binding protein n=1 Tax=Natronoflexus pectinivorans TaxID=682526 RepID=A0A4R2GL06_9BACT|nr:RagB/SusD family nutrient uptake outer membrane protein [Natronoflexus pectinivorans]TCO09266.1 putative outer membrane starch-binding protein [Natronoflexus pectinivorans]
MKKYINGFFLAVLLLGFVACSDDFLTVYPTESQEAGGDATEGAIMANLAASYQILLFDSYANNNYNSIFLMSDLRSDDILKGGGDAGDQGQLYRLSLLDATPDELPAGLWNIYYSGIARSNNAILACDNAVDVPAERVAEMRSEALFLRAYYTHWLWKFWGNIPYFTDDLPEPYMAPQYSADQIYEFIMEDLDAIIEIGALPMRTSAANDGRASMAATKMLRARVVMYQKDASRYAQVLADMTEIVTSGAYSLVDFAEIWTREGQFNDESIFEVNHLPGEYGGKTWASGWQGFGTNFPAFISPNDLSDPDGVFKGGWGFGPVRPWVIDIFESGDVRRDASINQWDEDQYVQRFQDTGYFMAKYAARVGYNEPPGDVDLNYENNLRIFRLSEAYLNIAELIVMHGQAALGVSASDALNEVRDRAGLGPIAATEENIKLERRREFLGEGMRFWDIVRWGDTHLLTESIDEFSSIRTWEPYKKYLPIPQSEIDRTEGEFKLVQNPGYN